MKELTSEVTEKLTSRKRRAKPLRFNFHEFLGEVPFVGDVGVIRHVLIIVA
jgi:hypothetical protein